jgi:GWxTD domain-containing protein
MVAPLTARTRPFAVLLTLLFAACAGGGGAQRPERPDPEEDGPLTGPLQTYQQIGLVAGPGYFPAVAGFSTIAGPADSTWVLFGMSLPNSALRFQRDPAGFVADYSVTLTFATADSQIARRVTRQESVRIPTFQETGRTDESVVFQHLEAVAPGTYIVTVQAGDANSSRGFRAVDTLVVPPYTGEGMKLAQPIIVYEGRGRSTADSVPDLILNPRHTIPYGGEAPRVYLEAYSAEQPVPVTISVIDELGNRVWTARTTITEGDAMLRRTMIELPAGQLPLGKLFVEIEAADGTRTATAPIVISISDQWMVANFDEVLMFIEYIATRTEIDSLRSGSPADRRRLWEDFWTKRDPLPATPANEYRDDFFQRVRYATEQFSEIGGQPGWRTDRGEVYIVLGTPSFAQERYIGRTEFVGRPNAWEWLYEQAPGGRLVLVFLDRTGFGRYELSPSSEASFRGIAERMKPRPDRPR